MSEMWRTSRTPRRVVLTVAVMTALAGAAPVAEASAPTPALPAPAVQTLAALLPGIPWSQIPVAGPGVAYANGAAAIRDVFNGGTTVCVSTGSSACSTNAAP
jgi:hypothetical protein